MAAFKASTTRRSRSKKTPAQIAAAKRNLEKARAARAKRAGSSSAKKKTTSSSGSKSLKSLKAIYTNEGLAKRAAANAKMKFVKRDAVTISVKNSFGEEISSIHKGYGRDSWFVTPRGGKTKYHMSLTDAKKFISGKIIKDKGKRY